MAILTIRLDDKLDRELTRLAARTCRTKSEAAREALRRQLPLERLRAHYPRAAMPARPLRSISRLRTCFATFRERL